MPVDEFDGSAEGEKKDLKEPMRGRADEDQKVTICHGKSCRCSKKQGQDKANKCASFD